MEFVFSAGVVVYKEGAKGREFLFLRRDGGWLDLPKGHIEKGEDSRTAALRELNEETGLGLVLDRFFRYNVVYWYAEKGNRVKKTVTFYLARAESGAKARVSWEHVGLEWLSNHDYRHLKPKFKWFELLDAANEYIDRSEKLVAINREYGMLPRKARKWGLSKRLVPGEGPANAEIMVVGQAPGRQEDESGRPFIGMAGKLLNHLLAIAGIKRESAYITSVVQFFPPLNRVPTDEEASLCRPFLERQIAVVEPKVIIVLGNFASQNITGAGSVMKIHGTMKKDAARNCSVFVTLHPAAAVRIRKLVPVIEGDFRTLKKRLKRVEGA